MYMIIYRTENDVSVSNPAMLHEYYVLPYNGKQISMCPNNMYCTWRLNLRDYVYYIPAESF